MKRFLHEEAGPQLVLQAFLQRVVNRGGRIEREYGLGRWCTDPPLLWPRAGGRDPRQMRKHAIECKVLRERRGREGTIREGLEQTAGYMDRSGAETGHLVIFDRRPDKTRAERVFRRQDRARGKQISVWGM